MAQIESVNASVGSLFSHDSFFRIPAYQRPFSWDDEQFDDLIVDIMNADRNTQYFLGTMVLHRDVDKSFVVVDGQQRLTSLLILLACLRDSIDDKKFSGEIQDNIMQKKRLTQSIPERVRLEVKDRECFQKLVVTQGGTETKIVHNDLPEPEWRYARAIAVFREEIYNLTEGQKQELVSFIIQNCVVIYLLANNFEQAFKLFEIVNDRGKQLRRIDILKSTNISPDVVAQDTVRNRIAQKWELLESEVGEDVFESVFFLVRLILLKDKPKGDLLKEFEERVFAKKLVQKGEAFADLIFKYVGLYRQIFLDRDYLDETGNPNIKYRAFIYIMDAEFKASEWRACLLFFADKFGKEKFFLFALALEKLFLTQWVQGIRKDERYSAYSKLLAAVEKEKNPDEVIASVPSDSGAIIGEITRENLYSAGFCKYVLLRLELLASEHDVQKLISAKSIEHVFPQNPDVESKWLVGVDPKELPKFVNKVGNLVLISKGRNSSASNLDFENKKAKYLRPRVSDYPRSNEIIGYDKWTVDTINDRTNAVAKIFLNDI